MSHLNRILLASSILLFLALPAAAQEKPRHAIPDSVFYLMPSFAPGYIWFRGQAPAQGKLNICAVDNTLRFIGKDGEELSASQEDNIVKVRIDTATFIRYEDVYYRIYPFSADLGVALRRRVRVEMDAKEAGYGTTSQTSATRQYSTIYADGALYNLDSDKSYPYDVTEEIFLYKGETVSPLTKKNLRKLFPSRKDEIDAWFKSGNSLPETVQGTLALLSLWAN